MVGVSLPSRKATATVSAAGSENRYHSVVFNRGSISREMPEPANGLPVGDWSAVRVSSMDRRCRLASSDQVRAGKGSAPRNEKGPEKSRGLLPDGDDRNRTCDLLNAIQALSQLSYTPGTTNLEATRRGVNVAPP